MEFFGPLPMPIPIPIFFSSALADDRYRLPIFLSRYMEPILLLPPNLQHKNYTIMITKVASLKLKKE